MGEVLVSTDDGSEGYRGFVSDLLSEYLKQKKLQEPYFFNCGPEIAMKKAVELNYAEYDKKTGKIEFIISKKEK